jgi:hypothetical protein
MNDAVAQLYAEYPQPRDGDKTAAASLFPAAVVVVTTRGAIASPSPRGRVGSGSRLRAYSVPTSQK